MNKSNVGWIFAICILAFLLVISLILGFTGYFFSISYLSSNTELKVGDNFSISVLPNSANVVSFTFDGAYLPDENIPEVVQINAQDLNADVWVRVKVKVFGASDDSELGFVTTEHFEKENDGYYYYDEVLKGGNKITFCNYIFIPKEINLRSGEKYIISFVVETLESKYDIGIWKKS